MDAHSLSQELGNMFQWLFRLAVGGVIVVLLLLFVGLPTAYFFGSSRDCDCECVESEPPSPEGVPE